MAKVFVVQGHANPSSFTQAMGREFIRALRDAQHEVLEINAYETDLPYAEPSRLLHHGEKTYPEMKEFVLQATALVFIFPVWFGGPPAAVKNVLDHFDFAYSYTDGKLTSNLRATHGFLVKTCDAPAGWSKVTSVAASNGIIESLKCLGVRRWGQYQADNTTNGTLAQRKRHMGRVYTDGQKFARSI